MPTKYNESYAIDAYELARDGKSDREIADCLEVPYTAIIKWKRKKPIFKEALERGRESKDKVTQEITSLTNPKQIAYLLAYVHNGTVTGAAKEAEVAVMRHYAWLEEDPNYKQAFETAKKAHNDILVQAAVDRGVYGRRKYKFTGKGDRVMIPCNPNHPEAEAVEDENGKRIYARHYYEEVYSDALLIKLLEAKVEEFKQAKQGNQTNVNVGGPTLVLSDILREVEQKRMTTIDADFVNKAADTFIEQKGLNKE